MWKSLLSFTNNWDNVLEYACQGCTWRHTAFVFTHEIGFNLYRSVTHSDDSQITIM